MHFRIAGCGGECVRVGVQEMSCQDLIFMEQQWEFSWGWCSLMPYTHDPNGSVWSATFLGASHKANIKSFLLPSWLYFAKSPFGLFILSPGIVPYLLPSFSRSPGHGGNNFSPALSCRDTLFEAGWQTHQHCWKGLQQILSTNPMAFLCFACKRWG